LTLKLKRNELFIFEWWIKNCKYHKNIYLCTDELKRST